MAAWSIEYALEMGSPVLATKVIWAKLQFLSIAILPAGWLVFVLTYTGRVDALPSRYKVLLSIIPLLTLFFVITNHLHGLVISDVTLDRKDTYSILVRSFGPWYWLLAAYSYMLVFVGAILLIRSFIRFPHRYRGQSTAFLVAAMTPLAGNVVYLLGLSPFPSLDLTPFAFSISCMALAWGVFHSRFLDIMPIAYDSVVSSMRDSVLILDDKNRILDVNPAAQTVLGKDVSGAIGQPVEKILAPWPDLIKHFQKHSEGNEEIVIDNGKQRRYFDLLNSPVYAGNHLAGRLVVFRDITKRKQYENALRESEERFRSAFDQALVGMVLVRLDGDFLAVNSYFCEMIGYSEEELLEMNIKAITHPDDLETDLRRLRELTEGNFPMVLLEKRFIRKDGQIVWGKMSSSIMRDSGGEPLYLVAHVQNISGHMQVEEEKKRLEVQTQTVQRLEAIGTLAGGIAHDFNNILMSIQGNVSLLRTSTDPGHPSHKKLQNIEHYIQSGAMLTRQLLGFARSGKYEVKAVHLNSIIEQTSQMFARTRKKVKIITSFQKALWTVNADQSQMEQILLNLYVNASQAMPEGGTLYLETFNTVLDETYIKPYKIKPGGYVKVSVTDTGGGMDASTQQRIFEPFFTTKEMGRGTGLGLASVYGIVKNHGGYINVYSEKGTGTTFNIYFPASDRSAAAETDYAHNVVQGTETILVVDDEEMIVANSQELLTGLGYKVLSATDGRQALTIYSNHPNQIDLVILDLIMPNMTGKDTFLKLKSINPDLKVLLSSGYSMNDEAMEIMGKGCNGFIQKPFSVVQLSAKIRKILGESAALA